MSDLAMRLGPIEEGTLLSYYFETMTDEVFTEDQPRGVQSRESAVIAKAACDGQQHYTENGTLENWPELAPAR